MKYWFTLCIILFCSCALPSYMTFEEAIVYARTEIFELAEPEGEDVWQYPWTTRELGTGDCEDIAGVIMEQSGEGEFVIATIEYEDNWYGHALVKWNNQYYDQYGAFEYTVKEIRVLSYRQYLRRCDI